MSKVIIKIAGKEIVFSHLTLSQEMCELNTFSFNYQIESRDGVTIDTYNKFYKDNLFQTVEILVDQRKIFEGCISAILCVNQYDYYIDFEVKGNCYAVTLNLIKECASHNKKSLSDIFKTLVEKVPAKIQPTYTEPLHYTAQFNVTNFEMIQLLCRREGEWMYYDGSQIVIAKPEGKAIQLNQKSSDVFDIQLNVKIPQGAFNIASYDSIKGDATIKTAKKPATSNTLRGIAADKQVIASANNVYQAQAVPFDDYVERQLDKYEAQKFARAIVLKGKTNNPSIALGSVVELMNNDKSEGVYVVISLLHAAQDGDSYFNEFEAIPQEEKYPPYVDPEAKIEIAPQYAIVTQNEDGDGLSRIKVNYYWSEDGVESCWMDVLTPHAGAGRGFRFLPEVGDEVLVDFYENNVEAPYAIGAVYSTDRKDGIPEEGNHIKAIATKSNRRLQFDEKRGLLFLTDFYNDDKSGNSVFLEKNDQKTTTHIYSKQSDDNQSLIQIDASDGINIVILDQNKETVRIKLDRKGKKLDVFAKAEITLHSEQLVKIKATDIELEGDQSIKMKTKKFELKSDEVLVDAMMEVALSAKQSMKIASNMATEIKGGATLDMNGGAKASLKGGVVMIN